MAVAFPTSTDTGNSASTSSRTPAVPSGAAAGDVMFAFLDVWDPSADPAITVPSGFQQLYKYSGGTGSTGVKSYCFWKRLTGADSGTYSFSWSGSMWANCSVVRATGVKTYGNPVDSYYHNASAGNSANFPTTSVTPPYPPGLLWHGYNDDDGTHTPPTNFTEILDSGFNNADATYIPGATGAYSAPGATLSATTTNLNASLIAVEPAGARPMAEYGFNEGSGTTTADSSGNGHTLTINSLDWESGGHSGYGIGNPGIGTRGQVALSGPTTAITIMGWVKPRNLGAGTTQPAFGFVQSDTNTACVIWTKRSDYGTPDVPQGNIRINGGLSAVDGASALTLDVWVHMAMTYDGTTVRFYLDGTEVDTETISGSVSGGDYFVVAGWSDNSYATNMIVDDVRVFDSALDITSITTWMNTPILSMTPLMWVT